MRELKSVLEADTSGDGVYEHCEALGDLGIDVCWGAIISISFELQANMDGRNNLCLRGQRL